jgi:hypothetical protein
MTLKTSKKPVAQGQQETPVDPVIAAPESKNKGSDYDTKEPVEVVYICNTDPNLKIRLGSDRKQYKFKNKQLKLRNPEHIAQLDELLADSENTIASKITRPSKQVAEKLVAEYLAKNPEIAAGVKGGVHSQALTQQVRDVDLAAREAMAQENVASGTTLDAVGPTQ